MKYLALFLKALMYIFVSVYLTFIVDVYTLNTSFKRVFVFLYFLVIALAFTYLRSHFIVKRNITKKEKFFSLIISIGFLLVLQNVFLPQAQETAFTLHANGDREVWLTDIRDDQGSLPLSQLQIEVNIGWAYSSEADDYVYYPSEESTNNQLTFSVVSKATTLYFAKNNWSGAVEVEDSSGGSATLNLHRSGDISGQVEHTVLAPRVYSIGERILYGFGVFIILVFFSSTVIAWLMPSVENKWRKNYTSLKKKSTWLMIGCCAALTTTIFTISFPALFYQVKDYELTITTLDEKNKDCKGYEISILPENYVSVASMDDGWIKMNNGFYFCSTPNQKIVFNCNTAHDNNLILSTHEYAAKMQIFCLGEQKTIDAYSPTHEVVSVPLQIEPQLKSTLNITVFVLLIFLNCVCIFFALSIAIGKSLNISFFAVTLNAFIIFKECLTAPLHYYIFIGLSIIAFLFLHNTECSYIQSYCTRRAMVLLIACVAAYAAFACFGFDLFLQGDFMDTRPMKWLAFICIWALMLPIIFLALYLFERAVHMNRLSPQTDRKIIHYFCIQCFLVMSVVLVAFCFIFAPANMTSDGVDQWMQALGYSPIYNAHPAIHTLFLRLCSKIYPSPITVTIAQALLFSYVVSCILGVLYRKGCSKKVLIIAAIILCILPNTIAMITLVSKNICFAILMLWMLYLLIEIFEDCKLFFHSPWFVVQLIFAIPLLYLIRHNTFVFIPIVVAVLIFCTIKFYKEIHIRPILCLFASFLIVQSITGPLYNKFDVDDTSSSIANAGSSSMIMPFIPALKFDVALPVDTLDYLYKMLPTKDEYVKRYAPYNSDIFSWTEPRPNFSETSLSEKLSQYLRFLVQRPDIVIKSRLDGINIIWDVFSHPGVRHDRYTLGIWAPSSYGSFYENEPDSFISERKTSEFVYGPGEGQVQAAIKYVSLFNQTLIFNSIFWRNGFYIILMLFSLIILIQHRSYQIVVIGLLPFLILCTLILAIGYQIYQYVWFFPLCIVALFAYQFSYCCEMYRQQQSVIRADANKGSCK